MEVAAVKQFIASTALLALSAGFASAEVTLSGDARMGLLGNGDDVEFIHRARVKFTLSGESDSGFSFGASFRADNAREAAGLGKGSAGEVFISGAFGTLTMGDIDNAAQAVVGQVDGVGLTGLGDLHEVLYMGDDSTSARYDYASGGLSFSASVGQNGSDDYAIAAAYSMDGYKFSVGYESGYIGFIGNQIFGGANASTNEWAIYDHIVLGADATVGSLTFKARYGMGSGLGGSNGFGEADLTQYALSATYTMDALAVTAFVASSDIERVQGFVSRYDATDRFGIGAAYDLGGGASLKAGYASADYEGCAWSGGDYCYVGSADEWDLGLSFEF